MKKTSKPKGKREWYTVKEAVGDAAKSSEFKEAYKAELKRLKQSKPKGKIRTWKGWALLIDKEIIHLSMKDPRIGATGPLYAASVIMNPAFKCIRVLVTAVPKHTK